MCHKTQKYSWLKETTSLIMATSDVDILKMHLTQLIIQNEA